MIESRFSEALGAHHNESNDDFSAIYGCMYLDLHVKRIIRVNHIYANEIDISKRKRIVNDSRSKVFAIELSIILCSIVTAK